MLARPQTDDATIVSAITARLFYIDESFDAQKFCLSAIGLTHVHWRDCFGLVREHREMLKRDHGIFMRKEIHSAEFVTGRGRIPDRTIGKHERSRIFRGWLRLIARLPKVMVINVCLDVPGSKDVQLQAWDRLLNRIERTMLAFEEREIPLRRALISEIGTAMSEGRRNQLELRLNRYRPVGIIVADQGREYEITKVIRKMSVFNLIPSMKGSWNDGNRTKNIPVRRVIEDPIFKEIASVIFHSACRRGCIRSSETRGSADAIDEEVRHRDDV